MERFGLLKPVRAHRVLAEWSSHRSAHQAPCFTRQSRSKGQASAAWVDPRQHQHVLAPKAWKQLLACRLQILPHLLSALAAGDLDDEGRQTSSTSPSASTSWQPSRPRP